MQALKKKERKKKKKENTFMPGITIPGNYKGICGSIECRVDYKRLGTLLRSKKHTEKKSE